MWVGHNAGGQNRFHCWRKKIRFSWARYSTNVIGSQVPMFQSICIFTQASAQDIHWGGRISHSSEKSHHLSICLHQGVWRGLHTQAATHYANPGYEILANAIIEHGRSVSRLWDLLPTKRERDTKSYWFYVGRDKPEPGSIFSSFRLCRDGRFFVGIGLYPLPVIGQACTICLMEAEAMLNRKYGWVETYGLQCWGNNEKSP